MMIDLNEEELILLTGALSLGVSSVQIPDKYEDRLIVCIDKAGEFLDGKPEKNAVVTGENLTNLFEKLVATLTSA